MDLLEISLNLFRNVMGLLASCFLNCSGHQVGGDGDHTSRASSSFTPPPPPPRQNYEVFLSFRGEDTRHGFTDHLYLGLVDKGIIVFRDNEELHVGEKIDQLFEAIKASKISIPIISPNYASSIWCLKELLQILECKKTSGQLVLPIFYKVKPSDVRDQKGDFGEKFRQCKRRHGLKEKFVEELQNAFIEIVNIKVWESDKIADGYEGELVKIVVRRIFNELTKPVLVVPDFLVGVEEHVEEIKKSIDQRASNDATIIGIYGMGGIGKTTLAKVIYNAFSKDFECCSFVPNIREASKAKGMEDLQRKIISNILGDKSLGEISHVDEGITIIKRRFKGKRVLLLLDDVENKDQLNKLAAKSNWFGPMSVVVITTRNREVTVASGVNLTYELHELNDDQSYRLFCRHAFGMDACCPEDLETIARYIVFKVEGLPLASEVIGSLLYGKDRDFWNDTLNELRRRPNNTVLDTLKISYDALEDEEKQIFLDIACLPIQYESFDMISYMWDSCRFYPKKGIQRLNSLSLIKIEAKNHLVMHDQLRDLGREIVRREGRENVGKCSRICSREEAMEVLEERQGTANVQALILDWPNFLSFAEGEQAECKSQQFEGMINLRFLDMKNVHLIGNFKNLFRNLRWLCWRGPSDIMGINFNPKKLVFLELWYSNITEHWNGWNQLKYLKALKLFYCQELTTTPDFSPMEELEVLELQSCFQLRKIHPSIGKLSKSLKVLSLKGCSKLEVLPIEFGEMEELTELYTRGTVIREIPLSQGYFRKLVTLDAQGCKLTHIPDSIGSLVKLKRLNLDGCELLTEIPESIGKLQSLTDLNLSGTRVTQLPDSIGDLDDLEKLCMADTAIKCLPTSIGKLKLLTEIDLTSTYLTHLPDSIGDLDNLVTLSLFEAPIKRLPTSIGKLHKLKELNLEECLSLTEIPESIGKLESLSRLNLSWTEVTRLPDSIGDLYNLEELLVGETPIKCLPTSIGTLNKLRELHLEECKELEFLPNLPCSLTFLEFNGDSMETLPDISILSNLQRLVYKDLFERRNRAIDLGKLNQLTSLKIHHSKLHIQKSIDPTMIPKRFDPVMLSFGVSISKQEIDMAPENFNLLLELPSSIEELEVIGCQILHTLPNLSHLKNLSRLRLFKCCKLMEINGLEGAESLTTLEISECHPKFKFLDLSMLRHLKALKIKDAKLVEIPGLQELKSLEFLIVSECNSLLDLPDLSRLANLRVLDIRGCTALRMLPDLPNVDIRSGPL